MDNVKMAKLLLALAALLPAAAADTPFSANAQTCSASTLNENGALAFIGVAFMLVSLLIALAYMYGKFRQDEKASLWAKDESQQLLITVLILAGVLVFFTGACELSREFAGGNPFQATYNYLNRLLSSNGLSVVRSLTYGSLRDQLTATQYIYMGFSPYVGYGMSEHANFKAYSAHKELLMDLYIPVVASISAQLYLLQAIEIVSLGVLLPFAFIMRIVPFTREFGNVAIALFFALYIAVPATYALSGQAYMEIVSSGNYLPHDFADRILFPGEQSSGSFFFRIGSTMPQAIFLPNLAIIIATACAAGLSKALRALSQT